MKRDPRLAPLIEICLRLPEAACDVQNEHAAFTVRKKTFAYFLKDHHGDGIVAVCAKVMPGDNKMLADSSPERFYLPAYIGARGWVGLRLDVGEVDWEEVAELVIDSYRRTAPKGLAAQVTSAPVSAST